MRRGLPSVRDFNRITIGIVSLVVIAAVVAAAFAIGTLGLLEHRYQASAVFEDTGGVKVGSKVRVAGVVVGEVSGVHSDFDAGQVIIDFEVDRGVNLGSDMTAEIALGTLLGGQYLRLRGDVEPPYLADLPEAERRIPLDRTVLPFTIIQALGDFSEGIDALDPETINAAVRALGDSTARNGDEVAALIDNLEVVTTAINEREGDLRRLVGNAQQVTATLASRDEQLIALIDSADVLLDQIVARRDELAAVLGSGSEVVTTLATLIDGQRANIDNILGDLHVTLGRVDANLPVINNALAWTGPAFGGLAAAGAQGPWFDLVVEGLGPLAADLITGLVADLLDPAVTTSAPPAATP
jgi:phospholipid/cholesterol/gamma-HCH transport system substrate-binding protein